MTEDQPQQLQMHVPEAVAAGTFADFVAISQNGKYFTLDFAAITSPVGIVAAGPGMQAQVVSRVRILPDQIFQLMRALNDQLAAYERATGRGAAPGEE